MFAGIVEAKVDLLQYTPDLHKPSATIRIITQKPNNFNDLSTGDSIAVNGICLTVEAFTEDSIQFALGAETIKLLGFSEDELRARPLNLERSLRFNDRIHGHVVTGHVDGMGLVQAITDLGQSRIIQIRIPDELLPLVWKKGSLCINGVSLTINEVEGELLEVCLIPETLKRTNLADLKVGERVTIEVDQMARGILRMLKLGRQHSELNN